MDIPNDEILWIGRPVIQNWHISVCLIVFWAGIWLLDILVYFMHDWPEYIGVAEIIFVAIPVLAAVVAGWTAINTYYTRWFLTEDTLYSRQNFFQGDYDTLWLHAIRDVGASKPLFYRFFGLGWVNLVTMDRTHPTLRIGLIPDAGKLKLKINEMARKSALDHGTRVIDWGG